MRFHQFFIDAFVALLCTNVFLMLQVTDKLRFKENNIWRKGYWLRSQYPLYVYARKIAGTDKGESYFDDFCSFFHGIMTDPVNGVDYNVNPPLPVHTAVKYCLCYLHV